MTYYNNLHLISFLQLCCLLFITVNSISGRRFPEGGFYSNGFFQQQEELNAKVHTALEKLDNAPELVNDWPEISLKFGQVSGVTFNNAGQAVVFHRASNVWDENTFTERNVYRNIGLPPIAEDTILVFNDTGAIVDKWGANMFYIPHGITVDKMGNYWVTDVALHQVFKFKPDNRHEPDLVLGEKFVPGNDDSHFCKPSAVAILPNGDFFVSDGYCNTRIIKFNAKGNKILQWGRYSGDSPYSLYVPHALTLAPEHDLVCCADREHGRVLCYNSDNGTYVSSYSSWLLGGRLFSVAYTPAKGGLLYVVNGPSSGVPVRGYAIELNSGRLVQTFAPPGDLKNPHDIAVSEDGSTVYVAEIDPYRVLKFVDESIKNESRQSRNITSRVKPTATVEVSSIPSSTGSWLGGASGAGAAALGAALLALAALALRTAASSAGRKSGPRRRWEYGSSEFKLRRLLARRGSRFARLHALSSESDDEPAPMLRPPPNAEA